MKYVRTAIMMIPLLMMGCLEVETTSEVHEDGSITRSIQLKGSAESISNTNFNIPRHEIALWEITQDSLKDDRHLYHAKAKFESVEALNQSFKLNTMDPGVQIIASLVRDEGFFFNRYYYRENIWADLPGPKLPLEPYLSQSELDVLIMNEVEGNEGLLDSMESARLEHQWELYMEQLIYDDFVAELRKGGKSSGNLSAIDGMVKEHSDSLMKALSTTNFYDENRVWKTVLGNYVDDAILDEVEQANTAGFTRFYKSWQFFEEVLMDDYSFSVELPGVIRNTSASDVRGNRMTWDPETIKLFFGGIALEAESSIVKPWSLVITGLILLLTLVVTLAGFIRQRNRKQAV
ncbi:MAG: hypothetical protein H8E26_04575 [FCB group bacterium]|nr:hypothetical protein [FCB group bacterium]MBL7028344.1 hypothetical protein [Candidatus Neomarinimicrobiota bacterium]MBL7121663.1 hypothetical protein [Candidatus Neomarinimicrobiota bacterium]